jgi:hypothetical protein
MIYHSDGFTETAVSYYYCETMFTQFLVQNLRPCGTWSIWYLYYVFHVYPLEKIVLVIFGTYRPQRPGIFGDPPPLNTSGKGRTQFQILRKAREFTNASAASQKQKPTASQSKRIRRQARNISQENQHHRWRNFSPCSSTDNILRPIIKIMLKALFMFVFL